MNKSLICLLSSGLILCFTLPAFAGSATDQIILEASGTVKRINFSQVLHNVFGRARRLETWNGTKDWYHVSLNGEFITSSGACRWTSPCIRRSQTQSPVFSLGNTEVPSNLLPFLLKLVDIQQVGVNRMTNNDGVDLTALGGTRTSVFNRTSIMGQLRLHGSGNLGIFAQILPAQQDGTTTPLLSEPSSLSMLGIGLLSAAVVIKRRIADSSAKPIGRFLAFALRYKPYSLRSDVLTGGCRGRVT